MANFPYMVSPLPKGKTVHRPFTKSIAPDYFGNWKFCIAKYGKDEKLVRPTKDYSDTIIVNGGY